MATIAHPREDVDRAVRETLDAVRNAVDTSAAEEEAAVWAALLGLGRALMAWFFAIRAARYAANDTTYEHGGLSYRLAGREEAEVGTRFGKVTFERPVGRVPGAPRWKRDLPLDRELGLACGFTLSVVTPMARLCAQMAFASARDVFEAFSPGVRASGRCCGWWTPRAPRPVAFSKRRRRRRTTPYPCWAATLPDAACGQ